MATVGDKTKRVATDWKIVRWVAICGYLIVLAVYISTYGVPIDRVGLTLWILAGLSTVVIGKGWRAWGRILLDWLPFQGILLAYDYGYGMASHFHGDYVGGYPVQGATNRLGMPLHVDFPVEFDKFLFGGTLPNQWVQQHLHASSVPWESVLVTLTYCSHFIVTPLIAVVLWIWARDRFRTWVKLVIAVAVAGLTTYFVYPMSPPWLASYQGYIPGDQVMRLAGQGWERIGFHIAGQVLSDGQARSNPVAAMPSLHMAYATLAAGFLWFMVRRWWVRCLLVLYPLVMAFSLIYGGEHYVTDEIAGVVYAVVILAVWRVLRRRSALREGSHGETLLGTADRPAQVVQGARGEPEAAVAERDRGVQADPAGVGGGKQMDRQLDVGEHHLRRPHARGDAVGGVDEGHERRERVDVDALDQ